MHEKVHCVQLTLGENKSMHSEPFFAILEDFESDFFDAQDEFASSPISDAQLACYMDDFESLEMFLIVNYCVL